MGTRKSNLIYRLRRKGFIIDTDKRTIYVNDIKDADCLQVSRLRAEYKFKVQLVF